MRVEFVGGPLGQPWGKIMKDLKTRSRGPAVVVVAFVGKDAPDMLNLRSGDALVCDAADSTIKNGITSAAALKAIQKKGVQVFSVPGLHAKVVATREWAWVGSANASSNSQHNLVEASARITGGQAQAAFKWGTDLCTEDRLLERSDLVRLSKSPVIKRPFKQGSAKGLVLELPKRLDELWIVCTHSFEPTRRELEKDEEDRGQLKEISAVAPRDLIPIRCDVKDMPKGLAKGLWVVDIHNGRPSRPGQVVAIKNQGVYKTVWLAFTETPRIARKSEIVELAPNWADEPKITDGKTLRKILSLYSI